ncbi:hypothetical protein AB0B45_50755 [Nonomuraea sp. NPDC049152]|uniref:hypothetical protein n=1 Tax=Nonomuraea sp. NPDC049152 TaxID=3154350 RepID=UPI0033E06CB6
MERAVDDFFAKYGRRGRKPGLIWRPWVEARVAEYGVAVLGRIELGVAPCDEDRAARERLYTM